MSGKEPTKAPAGRVQLLQGPPNPEQLEQQQQVMRRRAVRRVRKPAAGMGNI
jgi:hypothetical protein